MNVEPGLRSHSLPVAFVPSHHEGAGTIHSASAALMWIDRPFAVTAAHVVDQFLERLDADPQASVWIGQMRVDDLRDRLLCTSERHDLATIRVRPEELGDLGDSCSFHNPAQWPPPTVKAGDEITVLGFPRDQWPALVQYSFRVEGIAARRFSCVLESAAMPGRLAGLCGAPVFRVRGLETVFCGVVTETLFHNQVIRCQHALHVDTCGQVAAY